MQRSIKFRFFYKNKRIEDNLTLREIADKCSFHWHDAVVVVQYTGLGDSEAEGEYFGDIIEEDDGTRRVVEDECSVVSFRIAGGKNIKYFWDLLPHRVIGSIYENPELLEVRNDNRNKTKE